MMGIMVTLQKSSGASRNFFKFAWIHFSSLKLGHSLFKWGPLQLKQVGFQEDPWALNTD
jgi:hypothetical protein